MIIVLMGMDGVGKSTISLKIREELKNQKIKCYYFHAFDYTVPKTSILSEVVVKKSRHVLKIWPFIALLDNIITYKLKFQHFKTNSLLLLDRYFYDKFVKFIYLGICSRSTFDFLLRFIPKPDMIFLLDVPSEIAFSRKREHSLESFRVLRRTYLDIANLINPRPIIIDTRESIPTVTKKILEHITPNLKGEY